jgi:hypothetical protein
MIPILAVLSGGIFPVPRGAGRGRNESRIGGWRIPALFLVLEGGMRAGIELSRATWHDAKRGEDPTC